MFDRNLVAVRHPFLPIFLAILAFFVWAFNYFEPQAPVPLYAMAVILVEAGAWAVYIAVDKWHRGLMTPSFDREWQRPRYSQQFTNETMGSMSFIFGAAIVCSLLAMFDAGIRGEAGWYMVGTLVTFVATACAVWFVIDWLARSGSDGGTLIPTSRREPVLSLPRLHAT